MAVDQFVERGLKPAFDVGFQQSAVGLIGHSMHVSRRIGNRTGKGAFSRTRFMHRRKNLSAGKTV